MTQALRSPGSTLKPFIYGLGFEDGFIHPETLIEDRPVRYGSYAPENFDLTFQGTVTVRRALQMSLNVPAVAVLDKVGASRFTARLSQAGGALVLPKGEAPGLAMGLGGVGVTLTDLVMLYAGLARLGTTLPLVERMRDARRGAGAAPPARSGRGLVRRQRAARHAAARECRRRPHRLQDRHLLRLSRRLVGRLRRQAHHRRLGRPARWRAGAGPGRPRRPRRRSCSMPSPAPASCRRRCRARRTGTLFAATGKLPPPLQRFRPGRLPGEDAEPPLRIMFPPDGAQARTGERPRRQAGPDRAQDHRRRRRR